MPRSTKAEKETKRRKVASGAVAGKRTNAIARDAGCTPRHAQRLANEPATQFLITEALRPHRARLEKLATRVVAVVASGLNAKVGRKIDHFTRLRAVERYADLLGLAQGKKTEEQDTSGPMVTWEAFLIMRAKGISNASNPTVEAPVD